MNIPHLGQRIVKTTIAVFLCLLVCYLLGYRGADMPSEACITAIICMQPFVSDTRQYAVNRLIGTLIGSVWGLLLLLLLTALPSAGDHLTLLYLMMAVGTMLSIYTAVLLGKSDTSGLAAIVFLCIVISFPDIEQPLRQTLLRIGDVFLGTAIAIAVNTFRLPRKKNDDLVFFIRTKDLVPGRFAQMAPTVQFRLNRLSRDGAKICLVSEHAPAFFAMQLEHIELKTPMIVMDGAAIYDARDNRYLWTRPMEPASLGLLIDALNRLGLSYFVYTVHNNRTCVYHSGSFSDAENSVLERMKRSPYRDYLDGDMYNESEVVYVKVVDEDSRLGESAAALYKALPERRYRMVVRPQDDVAGVSSLYIYDSAALPGHARAVLLDMMKDSAAALISEGLPTDSAGPRKDGSELRFEEPVLKNGYRSEYDALRLLSEVAKKFEPVGFIRKRQR